jgi:hypothetical protein
MKCSQAVFVPNALEIVSIIWGLITQEGFIAYHYDDSLTLYEGE